MNRICETCDGLGVIHQCGIKPCPHSFDPALAIKTGEAVECPICEGDGILPPENELN